MLSDPMMVSQVTGFVLGVLVVVTWIFSVEKQWDWFGVTLITQFPVWLYYLHEIRFPSAAEAAVLVGAVVAILLLKAEEPEQAGTEA